jgi:hypothetical protein
MPIKLDWGQGYGLTEACTVTMMHPINTKPVLGSAGRLVTDADALVVTTDGNVCGVEERGELWIRAPSNTLGYYNNQKATDEMFLKGNWLRTGDEGECRVRVAVLPRRLTLRPFSCSLSPLVYFNKDGDCFITDRLKELIKVKGFQVAPGECCPPSRHASPSDLDSSPLQRSWRAGSSTTPTCATAASLAIRTRMPAKCRAPSLRSRKTQRRAWRRIRARLRRVSCVSKRGRL